MKLICVGVVLGDWIERRSSPATPSARGDIAKAAAPPTPVLPPHQNNFTAFLFSLHWCFSREYLTSMGLDGGGLTGTGTLLRTSSTGMSEIIALKMAVGYVP